MSGRDLRAAILVVSTTAFRDPATDACGKVLRDVFENDGGGKWDVIDVQIVRDIVLDIQKTIIHWADRENPVNLIISTGGTGFAKDDITPEAVWPLLHKQAPGIVHGMLAASRAITPFALMSRPVAGVRNSSIIITLPGSPKGAKENLQSILKLLPHACSQAAGADSRTLHTGGVKKLEEAAGLTTSSTTLHLDDHGHSHGHSCLHAHSHTHTAPTRHTAPGECYPSNDPRQGPSRRNRESPYPLLSVKEALGIIKKHTPPPQTTKVNVTPSLIGSVLAEDVATDEDVPAYRASIVDGYAVTASETGSNAKGIFPVASVAHAAPGEVASLKLGEIARVTTGAPIPSNATSVIMVEDTILRTMTEDGKEEKEVEILAENVKTGENIREVGSDIRVGATVLRKGEHISATGGELGLLVSIGKAEIMVYRKPIVGVLSTGNEIVQHDRPGELRLGEVRDCNRPTIITAVQSWGFKVVDLGICQDTSDALEETLRDSLRKVDVVVTTGGVSMGELDLLKPTIERSLGGTIHFGRVAMKPGKPTTFATVPVKNNEGESVSKVIFSLPGNPASALVTLHLFVLPSLHYASGVFPAGLPKVIVNISHEFSLDQQRAEYHRAIVTVGKDGILYASSTGGQRSSRVGSLRSANALLCLPTNARSLPKGSEVEALLMGRIQSEFNIE